VSAERLPVVEHEGQLVTRFVIGLPGRITSPASLRAPERLFGRPAPDDLPMLREHASGAHKSTPVASCRACQRFHYGPHLTPTEMGRRFGMHRREVIAKCMEKGVPILRGRIALPLFAAALKEENDGR
jgi:hypothetical protein